ncbi:MAG: hypothetical protein R3288_14175, partial [Woeseiaceae bacterium]|nr:hypothetical protein [Woeseiaceae bacterium]
MLRRSAELVVPDDVAAVIDVILLEIGPVIAESGLSLTGMLQRLRNYPVVALTTRENEHRGIAAVTAGAEAYLCIDDVSVDQQDATLAH